MTIQYEGSQEEGIENVNLNALAKNQGTQWYHLWFFVTLLVLSTKHQPTNAANPVTDRQIAATNYNIKGSNVYPEPAIYRIDPSVNLTLPQKFKIITRREWLAQPANEEATPLQLPVPYVFIMETGQEECTDQAACTFNVRFLQSFHIDSRGWDDIGYNFMVGGDGFSYEGRGWKDQGAHTYGYNSKSIGIAFIGTFNQTLLPERQTFAAKQLMNIGVEKGYIDPNFKMLATRQVETTKTPGLILFQDLQKWSHWAEEPTSATNPVTETQIASCKTEASHNHPESLAFPIDLMVNQTVPPKLNIISRKEWLAQPPIEEATPLQLPVPYVFIMETGQEECTDQAACTFNVCFLQSFHIDRRGWDDIGYNFLVGGDGFVYEGRGWNGQGAHTYGYNSKSIGVAFVGTFNQTMPPERQIIAVKQLINIGVGNGSIDPNFKLLATRQVESTKTPGLALFQDLQKWSHWAEHP